MIREELGPDAAVLHTREVKQRGLSRLWNRVRDIEVTASNTVQVPSRFGDVEESAAEEDLETRSPLNDDFDYSRRYRDDLRRQIARLESRLEDLCHSATPPRDSLCSRPDLPQALFHLFTDLIERDVQEELARELVARVQEESSDEDLQDRLLLRSRVARLVEREIEITGPLTVTPGTRRVVAMVGSTGVGKTTTIAKLAAIFRLKRQHRVGLITVDTYRVAAVEQLRTYAEIIDLPMEVVSTPHQMREAARRFSDLDLVLIDTAGRSPKDQIKIQELRALLGEASPDEVHLVLSSVASAGSLRRAAERFAPVGITALLFTKLDEAPGLGNLLPVLRHTKLPVSYLTDGQNVPDDIDPARPARLARGILGMEDLDHEMIT